MAGNETMKFLILCLFLCGCAETRIYEHGQLVALIQGDAVNVTIRTATGYFHADQLTHSVPTGVAYGGVSKVTGAVASGVVSGLLAKP